MLQTWDADYVANGCLGPPPGGSSTDNSISTCVVSVSIAVVAGLGAALIAGYARATSLYRLLASGFCGLLALGYASATIGGQVTADFQGMWFGLSALSVEGASALLSLLGAEVLIISYRSAFEIRANLRSAMVALALPPLVATAFTNDGSIPVLYLCAILVFMTALWSVRAVTDLPGRPMLKAISSEFMLAGLILKAVLEESCGAPGYEDCWVNCPLPNMPLFNHSALSNIFFCLGLYLLSVTMYLWPDLPSQGGGYELDAHGESYLWSGNTNQADSPIVFDAAAQDDARYSQACEQGCRNGACIIM